MSSAGSDKHNLSFTVNGREKAVLAYPMARLLDVLRQDLGLTGPKEGCGEGECGSCSILMNGELVNSCLIPVLQADGACLVTIEGVANNDRLSELQQTFLESGGAQCGICTPGMILSAGYLLSKKASPTLDEVREALAGNLCRCTGYAQILEAVLLAVARKAVT